MGTSGLCPVRIGKVCRGIAWLGGEKHGMVFGIFYSAAGIGVDRHSGPLPGGDGLAPAGFGLDRHGTQSRESLIYRRKKWHKKQSTAR